MRTLAGIGLYMVVAICCLAPVGAARSSENVEADAIATGRQLAVQFCSGCHAIDKVGDSPNPASPPFRTLSSRYPIESLEEALAEGISVGHAEMPQFEFGPSQVADLISYLKSVQPHGGK